MATFDEIFAGYEPPKANNYAMKRYFDEVFADYEPPKENEESGGALDTGLNSAKYAALSGIGGLASLLPDGVNALTVGMLAETAGNALQTLGDPDRTLAARYNPGMTDIVNSAGGFAQDIADSALEYGLNQIKPRNSDEYLGNLSNEFDSGYYGVLSGDASMLHSDKAAAALNNAIQQLSDKKPTAPALSLEYLTSPHGLIRSFGNLAGSMAAIMPSMVLMPESAAVRGSMALGGNAIMRQLIKRGLPEAAHKFGQRAPEIFRYGVTSPWAEGFSEGGHVRADNLAIEASNTLILNLVLRACCSASKAALSMPAALSFSAHRTLQHLR